MMNLENMVQVLASETIAKYIVQLWENDEESLELWRASSNFVYAFKRNQKQYFLRFNFEQDRAVDQLKAELEYMQYLYLNGFPSVIPILSKNGELIEQITTPEGTYIAVVFSKANGINLDSNDITKIQMEEWGKSLGSLHTLSKKFEPEFVSRKSWLDTVDLMEGVFQRHPSDRIALEELNRVTSWLQSLPKENDTYGLIHYDFQLDNIFFEENKNCFNVIDFDDAMYHWYAIDIVTALDDFIGEENHSSKVLMQSFLNGYRSKMNLEIDIEAQFPRFQRYANLYKFYKLSISLDPKVIHDAPPWYHGLRGKLLRVKDDLSMTFQKPW